MLEAGAFSGHNSDSDDCEFAVVEVDVEESQLRQDVFKWNSAASTFQKELSRQRQLDVKIQTQRIFEPSEAMRDRIEDLGAPFAHPTKEKLRLSDVYVDLRLRKIADDEQDLPITRGGDLLSEISDVGWVLIRGDEHCGKTSFLGRAFLAAVNLDMVPIVLSAREISTGSDEARESRIREMIGAQFNPDASSAAASIPKERFVLLIDDIDRLPNNVDAYIGTLSFLMSRYPNVIVTAGDMFDATVLGSAEIAIKQQIFCNFAKFLSLRGVGVVDKLLVLA